MADLFTTILQKRLASRIEKARRVRTLEGSKHFGLPIGSPIPTGAKAVSAAGRAIAQRGEGRGTPVKPKRAPSRTKPPVTTKRGRKRKPPKPVGDAEIEKRRAAAVEKLSDRYGEVGPIVRNQDATARRLKSVTAEISKKYGIKKPSIKRILGEPSRKNQKRVSDEDRAEFRQALLDYLSETPYATNLSRSDKPAPFRNSFALGLAVARKRGRDYNMPGEDVEESHQEGHLRAIESLMTDSGYGTDLQDKRRVGFVDALDYKPERATAWADRDYSLRTGSSDAIGLSDLDDANNVWASMVAARTRSAAQTIRDKRLASGRAKRSKAERENDRRDIYESIQSMSDSGKARLDRVTAIVDRVEESDALFAITALVESAKKNELSGGSRITPAQRTMSESLVSLLEKAGLVGSKIDVEVVKHNTKGLPVIDDDGNPVTVKQSVFIERSDFRDMKPLQILAMFVGDEKVNGVFSPEQISDLTGLTEANLRQSKTRGKSRFMENITGRAQLHHLVDMDELGEERAQAKEALDAMKDYSAFGRYEAMLRRRDRRVRETIDDLVKEQSAADTVLSVARERIGVEPDNAEAIKEIADMAYIRRLTAERDERIVRRDDAIEELRAVAPEVLRGDMSEMARRRSEAKRRAAVALERYADLEAEYKLREGRNAEFIDKDDDAARRRMKPVRRTLPSGKVVEIRPYTDVTEMRKLRDDRDRALSSSVARPSQRDQKIISLIGAISEHDAHIAEINDRHGDIIGVRNSLDELDDNTVFVSVQDGGVDERVLSRTLLARIRAIPVNRAVTEVRAPEIKEEMKPTASALLVGETLRIKGKISSEQKRATDSPELQELGDLMVAIAGHDGLLREMELSGVSSSDQEYASVKSVMDDKVRSAAELSRKLGITSKGTRKAPTIEQYAAGVDSHLEQKASQRAAAVAERAAREASRPPAVSSAKPPPRMTLKEIDAEIKRLGDVREGPSFARLNALTIESRRRRFEQSKRQVKKSANRLKVIRLLTP